MSKERLEENKGVIHSWLAWDTWNEKQREVLNDILMYIEQAERAEELEKQRKEDLHDFVGRIVKQNKRYREAL